MEAVPFLKRGLPSLEQLITTDSSSTSTSSSSSGSSSSNTGTSSVTTTSIDSSSIIESTKTSNTAVSTSTIYVAAITPPTANNNPFIYHAGSMPDGTVFIAVGCIVGAIFFTIFTWWCFTTYISFRNTKEANRLLNNNTLYYSMEKQPLTNRKSNGKNNIDTNGNRIISDSSSLERMSREDYEFEEKYLNRSDDLEFGLQEDPTTAILDHHRYSQQQQQQQQPFSVIQSDLGCRNSLFISPTLQLSQRTDDMYQTPTKNTGMNSEIVLDKPSLTASPERIKRYMRNKHRRNQSSLGKLSASPSKSQIELPNHHHKSASMYLEDILDSNK